MLACLTGIEMMKVGIKQAKIDLSKLVKAARQGKRVILMNRDQQVAEIVPIRQKQQVGAKPPGYGMFKNELNLEEGWDSTANMKADTNELMAVLNRESDASQ